MSQRHFIYGITVMLMLMACVAYSSTDESRYPLIGVQIKDKTVFVNKRGARVLSGDWNIAEQFEYGVAIVRKTTTNENALISLNGDFIVPYTQNKLNVSPLTSTAIEIYVENQGGEMTTFLYNQSCGIIANISPYKIIFDEVNNNGNVLAMNEAGLFGYLNLQGQVVIPFEWETAEPFREGLAFVSSMNYSGFINEAGRKVIPADEWDIAYSFHNGVAIVMKSATNEMSAISSTGEKLFDFIHLTPLDSIFRDDWCPVLMNNESLSYVNTQGKLMASDDWSDIRQFTHGYAGVQNVEGKWGFVDSSGSMAIHYQFDHVDWLYDQQTGFDEQGVALVTTGDSQWLINAKGDIITNEPYDYYVVDNFTTVGTRIHARYIVSYPNQSQFGLLNANGNLVYAIEYKEIMPLEGNIYALTKEEGTYYGDQNGEIFFVNRSGELFPANML